MEERLRHQRVGFVGAPAFERGEGWPAKGIRDRAGRYRSRACARRPRSSPPPAPPAAAFAARGASVSDATSAACAPTSFPCASGGGSLAFGLQPRSATVATMSDSVLGISAPFRPESYRLHAV